MHLIIEPSNVPKEPTCVIVMTFWYIFGTDLTFFELFKLLFSLGIDHDPHVFYVHETYVYSFSHVSFCTITWPREVIIVL